jgi:hypothetical protein
MTGLLLTGCGPSESRAQDAAEVPDRVHIGPAAKTPAPDTPAPSRPVHPTVAAMVAAHIEGLMADYHMLESEAEEVRSAVEAFRARHGRAWSPDPLSPRPWEELIRRRLLRDEPVNPFSPPDVAAGIHVIREPRAAGEAVSPKTAGWVWNSADEVLDAAKDSAAIRACRLEQKRRTLREKVGPYLDPRLKLLRAQITLYQLYEAGILWGPGKVAEQQWAPLVDAGYLTVTPQNPLSPAGKRSTIVEIRTAGAGGSTVDPDSAGWVWNSADRRLYAAGYDE